MKNKSLLKIAVISALLTFSASTVAKTCYVDKAVDAGIVAKAATRMGTRIAGDILKLNTALLVFLQKEAQQKHADTAKSQVIEKTIAEATRDTLAKERFKENVAKISARTADNGQACYSVSAALALSNADKSKKNSLKNLSNLQKKRTLETTSLASVIQKTYKDHDKFCSEKDEKRGRCAKAVSPAEQDLDLTARNIFSPNDEKTYSATQLEAAIAFTHGVANPYPSSELPQGYEKSQQGQAFIVAKRAEQQKLSLVYESMNQIIASRMANNPLGGGSKLSQMGDMQKVANSAMNPKWHKQIATVTSENQLLKENVKQAAFRNMVDYNNYLQMERVESVLAATLASSVKEKISPLIDAQRKSAAQSAGRSEE